MNLNAPENGRYFNLVTNGYPTKLPAAGTSRDRIRESIQAFPLARECLLKFDLILVPSAQKITIMSEVRGSTHSSRVGM